MFRSCLAAALRSLARSRIYSAISVFGLAIGLCAAILVGLIVHNESSYDRFLPGYQHIYLAGEVLLPAGHPGLYSTATPSWIAAPLGRQFPQIEAVTRLARQDVRLQQGVVGAREAIYWADPNVFDVLRFPTLAGDLRMALRRPDGIVLSRAAARKYFGHDDPLGKSVLLNSTHAMTVTAVIADLPVHNTQFETAILASGAASFSDLTHLDSTDHPDGTGIELSVLTYFRLAPNASIERLRQAMPDFFNSVRPERLMPAGTHSWLDLMRLDEVHLSADVSPGVASRLLMIVVVGVLILAVAAVNFVNLTTARAARRALEVGIRKASGAGRGSLIVQFLGEALLYTLIAALLAVMLVELLLPAVNDFLQTGATFTWWREPLLIGWIAAGTGLLALLAGSYPAFLLSTFRPVAVLKSRLALPGGSTLRLLLVSTQFAVLMGLVIAAGVVYEQREYATHEALRVNTDQVLLIRTRCERALEDRLRALGGVVSVACSDESLLSSAAFGNYKLRDGSFTAVDINPIEPGVLQMLGLPPRAGQYPQAGAAAAGLVINETATRRFGFKGAAQAVGQYLPIVDSTDMAGIPIVAVAPDFSINAVNEPVRPAVYTAFERNEAGQQLINIKLAGHDIPRTLLAIDHLLTATQPAAAIDRQFLNDYIQNLYSSVRRQEQALAFSAAVAVLIACLGLVGLSASLAQRRTKEIGIRKAMGAQSRDILRMLLWQFTQPVLGAMVVAWLVAGLVMNRWLHGFAYHVELDWWLMLAAAVVGLLLALATVGTHCYLIARARPVAALRYE
ncbi:MAG: ABC transporter permease [Proteobacteria bacterium]|nr:ABC transporter permease [Pseudomonadota bacterium]